MKNRTVLLSLSVAITLPGVALAQLTEEDAMDAITDRQAVFRLIAHSNRPLGEMLRGRRDFDLDVLVKGSRRIAVLAGMIPEMFETDTRGHEDLQTRASSLIWNDKDNFVAIAAKLEEGANKAVEILQTQGEDGLRQAADEITPQLQCLPRHLSPALQVITRIGGLDKVRRARYRLCIDSSSDQ